MRFICNKRGKRVDSYGEDFSVRLHTGLHSLRHLFLESQSSSRSKILRASQGGVPEWGPPRTQPLGKWRVDPEVQENANKRNACMGWTGLSLQWRTWPVGGDEQTENLPICLRGSSLSPPRPLRLGARWHPCSSSGPGPPRSNIQEAVFLGLSPRRDRVPKGVPPKDWEAIRFSDEETLTWKQLRVIFEVIYFAWFIERALAVRGTWTVGVCVFGGGVILPWAPCDLEKS